MARHDPGGSGVRHRDSMVTLARTRRSRLRRIRADGDFRRVRSVGGLTGNVAKAPGRCRPHRILGPHGDNGSDIFVTMRGALFHRGVGYGARHRRIPFCVSHYAQMQRAARDVPTDSVLRRHYEQMQQAAGSSVDSDGVQEPAQPRRGATRATGRPAGADSTAGADSSSATSGPTCTGHLRPGRWGPGLAQEVVRRLSPPSGPPASLARTVLEPRRSSHSSQVSERGFLREGPRLRRV